MTFAVTPVTTVIGWRWHQILARDLGLWTFALAALELVLAATMSSDSWRALDIRWLLSRGSPAVGP